MIKKYFRQVFLYALHQDNGYHRNVFFLMKFNVLDNGSSDFLLFFLSRKKTFLNEINGDADDNNVFFAG